MKREQIKNLVLTAMFLALGLVLPFLTGQIPQIGSMLLPMHIPVFLCALVCGWKWATPMAAVLPVMRSLIFGMPPLYPTAVAMAFELATYAFVAGFIYFLLKKKDFMKRVGDSGDQAIIAAFISLISAMIFGRAVWGCAQAILLGFGGKSFTFAAFIAGAFTNAVPGIILQFILIPNAMFLLNEWKLVRFDGAKN